MLYARLKFWADLKQYAPNHRIGAQENVQKGTNKIINRMKQELSLK